jgi:hypothetical protein
VMPEIGGVTVFDRLPKKKRTAYTKTMPRPKVTRSWSSFGRV